MDPRYRRIIGLPMSKNLTTELEDMVTRLNSATTSSSARKQRSFVRDHSAHVRLSEIYDTREARGPPFPAFRLVNGTELEEIVTRLRRDTVSTARASHLSTDDNAEVSDTNDTTDKDEGDDSAPAPDKLKPENDKKADKEAKDTESNEKAITKAEDKDQEEDEGCGDADFEENSTKQENVAEKDEGEGSVET